jgi:hypothetical protein
MISSEACALLTVNISTLQSYSPNFVAWSSERFTHTIGKASEYAIKLTEWLNICFVSKLDEDSVKLPDVRNRSDFGGLDEFKCFDHVRKKVSADGRLLAMSDASKPARLSISHAAHLLPVMNLSCGMKVGVDTSQDNELRLKNEHITALP